MNKLVIECFSINSSADIAKVLEGTVLGSLVIKLSAVSFKILSPRFSRPLRMSPSVIMPVKLSSLSNTPVKPNPLSDILNMHF